MTEHYTDPSQLTAPLPRMFRSSPVTPDDSPDWFSKAACAEADPEMFFPDKGGSTLKAKRICADCEVRSDCLLYALTNDEREGIWGGLSVLERKKMRKGTYVFKEPKPPRVPKRPPAQHGTRSMYVKGCRTVADCPRGEDGLTCVQANRNYVNALSARRRAGGEA